jgi:hypothetical protein
MRLLLSVRHFGKHCAVTVKELFTSDLILLPKINQSRAARYGMLLCTIYRTMVCGERVDFEKKLIERRV